MFLVEMSIVGESISCITAGETHLVYGVSYVMPRKPSEEVKQRLIGMVLEMSPITESPVDALVDVEQREGAWLVAVSVRYRTSLEVYKALFEKLGGK